MEWTACELFTSIERCFDEDAHSSHKFQILAYITVIGFGMGNDINIDNKDSYQSVTN